MSMGSRTHTFILFCAQYSGFYDVIKYTDIQYTLLKPETL